MSDGAGVVFGFIIMIGFFGYLVLMASCNTKKKPKASEKLGQACGKSVRKFMDWGQK